MAKAYFICPPDKERISIETCLKACRLDRRCSSLAYLRMVAYERPWTGITPSMAGNGTRMTWLKLTKDYAFNPHSEAFAVLGTGVHGKLALAAYTDNVLSEEPLDSGTPDCLEQDPDMEAYHLFDYKTWGSWKVAKSIGMVSREVPLLDENDEPILLKSGKNKGKPKTKKEFHLDPSKAEIHDTALQLNRYRIGFERLGFPINLMQVQAVVRDGNTYIAKSRGITEQVYLINVPHLPDYNVLKYYEDLAEALSQAFKDGYTPKCNSWENWDGKRCEEYCDVKEFCDEIEENGNQERPT